MDGDELQIDRQKHQHAVDPEGHYLPLRQFKQTAALGAEVRPVSILGLNDQGLAVRTIGTHNLTWPSLVKPSSLLLEAYSENVDFVG